MKTSFKDRAEKRKMDHELDKLKLRKQKDKESRAMIMAKKRTMRNGK